IINFVPRNSMVVDIGTDHGYIPVYLTKNNISKLAIASDISSKSLEKTIDYIKKEDLTDYIIPRMGDGLAIIKPYEVDTAIIAGMGGILIRDILERDKEITDSITSFILQPMSASKELRKYLIKNGFKIVDEELVKEGRRFYEIIYAQKCLDFVEKTIYYEISKKLIEKQDPLLQEFIISKINKLENIIEELKNTGNEESIEKGRQFERKIIEYKEVLDSIES